MQLKELPYGTVYKYDESSPPDRLHVKLNQKDNGEVEVLRLWPTFVHGLMLLGIESPDIEVIPVATWELREK